MRPMNSASGMPSLCLLRGDAGDQGGAGCGQQIVGWPAPQHARFVERVERAIGADRRELHDAGATRVFAEGFEVVPEETLHCVCPYAGSAPLYGAQWFMPWPRACARMTICEIGRASCRGRVCQYV